MSANPQLVLHPLCLDLIALHDYLKEVEDFAMSHDKFNNDLINILLRNLGYGEFELKITRLLEQYSHCVYLRQIGEHILRIEGLLQGSNNSMWLERANLFRSLSGVDANQLLDTQRRLSTDLQHHLQRLQVMMSMVSFHRLC